MTSIRTTLLPFVSALALALAPLSVHAQDEARARALLAEAQGHEDEERYVLAAQLYLELYDVMEEAELARAPVALWSAGNALSQVAGQERRAIDALRRYLDTSSALASGDEQIREWRAMSEPLIEELEARAPSENEPGGSGSERLDPPEGVPTQAGEEAAVGESVSPIGPIVLGVGGAALLTGIVVGAVSLSMDSSFRGACDDLTRCTPALRPQYDEMRAFSTAADVLMVAGGAVVVLGLVLTLMVTEPGGESVSASAACSPDGCLATARGRF